MSVGPRLDELRAAVREHRRSPLNRSGYALLISSIVTSVLGLVYWFLAARLYPADALGRGAALVSAMVLVTSLATAGLKRGLVLFVAVLGRGIRRFVANVYAAALAITLAGALLFVGGVGGLSAKLVVLHRGLLGPGAFVLATAAWAVFVLQDAVLIGTRRSSLVPLENAAFSVAKIVLLVIFFLTVDAQWGVFLSWVVPALGAGVAINWWLFGPGLRERERGEAVAPPTLREVSRFAGADYVAAISWLGAVYLTPLLVVARAGATANAHFYLAFQIGYTLFLVSSNISDALVADASGAGPVIAAKVRRAGLQVALVLVPGVVAVLVAAPWITRAFGPGYGSGARVLQLLALAAVPNALTTMLVAVAHLRRRMWLAVAVEVTMAALTLGLGWILLARHGIVGVALAWLIAQCAAAVVAVALSLHAEVLGRQAARARVLGWVAAARRQASVARSTRLVDRQVGEVPRALRPRGPRTVLSCQHDLAVVLAGTGVDRRVLRLAVGPRGRAVVSAHHTNLAALHADPRTAQLHPLVPRVMGHDDGSRWLVESACSGTAGSDLDPQALDRAVGAGLATLERLHGSTAQQLIAGPTQVDAWVHRPIAVIADVVRDPEAATSLAVLHRRLTAELAELPLTVARLHGDVSLDNLLFTDDGATVTGIVDWESSRVGPPELDVVALVLSRRAVLGSSELGAEVLELLRDGWRPDERAIVGACWSVNAHVRPTTLVLLAWLAHVADNLEKTERYRTNRWWVRHNVEQVLATLGRRGDLGSPPPLPPVVADPVVARSAGPARPRPPAAARPATGPDRVPLAALAGGTAACAGLAYLVGAPAPLRVVLVLLAVVVAPALALGRRLGSGSSLARGVVGAGGAVAFDMVVAEVLLYTGWWSPALLVVAVGVASTALAWRAPPAMVSAPR